MTRPEIAWSLLRPAIAILLGACVLSAGLLAWSYHFAGQMQDFYERQHREFLSASRRYIAVDDEEQLIRAYTPRFQTLERRGVIGAERRLDWAESLRSVGLDLKLPSLRYDIQPQQSYRPAYPVTRGAFQVYATKMRLSLGLLHEADLLRLLRELNEKAVGQFTVERCTLRRTGPNLSYDIAKPNLSAECELLWMTLRRPS